MGRETVPSNLQSEKTKFRDFLIALREKQGISQALLAFKAKLARSTVIYIEKGKKIPSLATLIKIEDALGLGEAEKNSLREYAGYKPPEAKYLTLSSIKSTDEVFEEQFESYTEEVWICTDKVEDLDRKLRDKIVNGINKYKRKYVYFIPESQTSEFYIWRDVVEKECNKIKPDRIPCGIICPPTLIFGVFGLYNPGTEIVKGWGKLLLNDEADNVPNSQYYYMNDYYTNELDKLLHRIFIKIIKNNHEGIYNDDDGKFTLIK